MKVMQVCAYAAPYEGNFMKSLYALSSELKKHGHNTIYVFPENASRISWCQKLAEHETVYFLPLAKARIKPTTYFALKRIFAKHLDIAVVHSHFELYDLPLAVVTPKHIKLIWHLHDAILPSGSKSRELLKALQYKYFSKKATLISVADEYKNKIIEIGFPSKQAYTVLNGIDLQRIHPVTENTYKEFDFLAFVWSYNVKDCDIILDACEILLQNKYSFKILLIGNDITKQQIEMRFPEGIGNIVLRSATEDVNELYQVSSVFISASRAETFSYAVCEAAYAGLPIISSKIPGLAWASPLPTVDFFESGHSYSLYEKMKDYLDGKIVPDKDIVQTRNLIATMYSAENWANQVYELYEI